MAAITCVIVEDTEADLALLKHYVAAEASLQLLATFQNPLEAAAFIRECAPQLLLLDIDMPLINGLEFFKMQPPGTICVFVTAHSDFAVESYEAHAFDFILKPVTPARLQAVIARLEEYLQVREKAELYDASFEQKAILLKEGSTQHRVALADIIYLEALKDYTKVVTTGRKYIVLNKLKHFMEKLPATDFVRVHRSFGLSKNKVQKIAREEVMLSNGMVIPIGKTYRSVLG
ncbi:MAG TPA: LytTR family DNA-binding domain-containing protein [Chitinophagaceae bacterium]|jgi:DNA-binding LytR/AlgR family response regulator|nr:LytTR family DNA-binding domain-containing protein [Chitinophagaceae bacterium]